MSEDWWDSNVRVEEQWGEQWPEESYEKSTEEVQSGWHEEQTWEQEGEEQWGEQWPEESYEKSTEDPVFFGRAVEEEVPVPKALLGKIIGKRAATILHIREKSGAHKVDAKDQSQDPCMVKVAGSAEAVKKAKQMIFQLLNETETRFQGCEFVELPRAQIPKGWQLKEAQQQTQTKIDLDLSSGDPCKCYIGGEPENVECAKAMLFAFAMQMEEDEQSEYLDLPNWISEKVFSDPSRLSSMQEISNARIEVDTSGATCRVRVSGSQESVDRAKSLIQAELDKLHKPKPSVARGSVQRGWWGQWPDTRQEPEPAREQVQSGWHEEQTWEQEGEEQWGEQWPEESYEKSTEDPVFFGRAVEEEVPVPKALLGKIIGKRAATILHIREKSGAHKVDAKDQSQDPCMVKVAGSAEAVKKAKQMIFQLLNETETRFQGCEFVELPRAQIPKGWQLNEAQQQTQTKIDLDLSTGDPCKCKCYIRGEPQRVEAAKAMLLNFAMQLEDEQSEYLDLPKRMSEALLSADAARLRSLQKISNARIDVDKSGATCRVRLSGSQDSVNHAKSLIQAEVEQVNQPRGVKRPRMELAVEAKLQQLEALQVDLNDEARQGLQVSDPSSAVVLLQALRSVVARGDAVDASAFVCERLAKMARRAPAVESGVLSRDARW